MDKHEIKGKRYHMMIQNGIQAQDRQEGEKGNGQ